MEYIFSQAHSCCGDHTSDSTRSEDHPKTCSLNAASACVLLYPTYTSVARSQNSAVRENFFHDERSPAVADGPVGARGSVEAEAGVDMGVGGSGDAGAMDGGG